MLSDFPTGVSSGTLSPGIHRPAAWLDALVDFILDELPKWRSGPGRPPQTGEVILTAQLCSHLNSAARMNDGFDVIQFKNEEPDPVRRARKLDMVPAPCGVEIWIEGRKHSHYDPLVPIECKRLPIPPDREKREYLRTVASTTGGVQRFKEGHHGSWRELGVMIAYVQSEPIVRWIQRIDRWVKALARIAGPVWTSGDRLHLESHDPVARVAALTSVNGRSGGLAPIRLRHLWIEM